MHISIEIQLDDMDLNWFENRKYCLQSCQSHCKFLAPEGAQEIQMFVFFGFKRALRGL